jgi:hypothetical protein
VNYNSVAQGFATPFMKAKSNNNNNNQETRQVILPYSALPKNETRNDTDFPVSINNNWTGLYQWLSLTEWQNDPTSLISIWLYQDLKRLDLFTFFNHTYQYGSFIEHCFIMENLLLSSSATCPSSNTQVKIRYDSIHQKWYMMMTFKNQTFDAIKLHSQLISTNYLTKYRQNIMVSSANRTIDDMTSKNAFSRILYFVLIFIFSSILLHVVILF